MAPTYSIHDDFKSNFGIEAAFTDDDAFIDKLLESEEDLLQYQLGYTFGEDSDRIDEWYAAIEQVIIPPKIPISSIDTLKIDDATIDSDYYDISEDKFHVWLDEIYNQNRHKVELYLKYTCGYTTSTLPQSLKNVLYWRAGYVYATYRTTIRRKAGGLKGRFEGIKELQKKADQIVRRYSLHSRNYSGKLG